MSFSILRLAIGATALLTFAMLHCISPRCSVFAGFTHTAFVFGYEAHLEKLGHNPAQFPPNMLIDLVIKGLEYKEMEANTRVEDLDTHVKIPTQAMLQYDVPSLRQQVKDKLKAVKADAEATVLGADPEGQLKLQAVRLPGHKDAPYVCRWHPQEELLASGAGDGTVRLWDVSQSPSTGGGIVLQHFQHDGAGGPSGQTAATGGNLQKQGTTVTTVAWSPDGSLLASGGLDGKCKLWYKNGTEKAVLSGHSMPVFCCSFNSTGRLLLTGSVDQQALVWSVAEEAVKFTYAYPDGHVMDVAWQAVDRFAVCTSDGAIKLFSLSSPDPVRTWRNAHSTEINVIEWNGTADVLASSSADKSMKLWREASDTAVMTYTEHQGEVYQVRWSPQASAHPTWLATTCEDNTLKLWDVERPASLHTFQGGSPDDKPLYTCAFTWDGRYLAAGDFSGKVRLYCTTTMECIQTLQGDGIVYDVQWNQDNVLAACSGTDLWLMRDVRMPSGAPDA